MAAASRAAASGSFRAAVMAALSALFPQRAFGHGYDALLGLLLALALFTIVAVVVSLVTGSRVHRRGLG